MARVRVHQHVNPLADYYRQLPIEPLDVSAVFDQSDNPIHIDIGCGRGRFLAKMARAKPDWNFLGLEIREPLVEEANRLTKDEGISNLHYYFCNAPLDLGKLLENVDAEQVILMTIQFPDPWFKKRHAKRRMVNKELVRLIDENLAEHGNVFVQTDVGDFFEDIAGIFGDAGFESDPLQSNPLEIKTEREISVENRGLDVFRAKYRRG